MSFLSFSVPTILLAAIAAAAVLVYVPFLVVAYARVKSDNPKDMMATPRAMTDKLPAYAQRATWAHQNSWEAFMIFSVAALMAYVTGQTSPLVAIVAIVFLVARFLFSVFYILNVTTLRSLMFGIGTICDAILIGLSISSSMR